MTGTLHEDRYQWLIISRWILLRMKNVSEKSCRENRNTSSIFFFFFFRKSSGLWDSVKKNGRAVEAIDDNMALAHFMLDTEGYKHTFRIWNTVFILFTRQQWFRESASTSRVYFIVSCVHNKHRPSHETRQCSDITCIITGPQTSFPSQKRNQTCYNVRAYCGT